MQQAALVAISEPKQNQDSLSQCFEAAVQKPTNMLVVAAGISFWFDEKYLNDYEVW